MKEFPQKIIQRHIDCIDAPKNEDIIELFQSTISLLYPFFEKNKRINIRNKKDYELYVNSLSEQLCTMIDSFPKVCPAIAKEVSIQEFIPVLYESLEKDLTSIFLEDPAAKSKAEIVRCYPGFFAVAAHRFAHWLHSYHIRIIPRIISEYAHSKTGIDIHPAAQIGESFCIDHGTGVVIGETAEIGANVKLYQGVTLGALSVQKVDANKKRHPTIKDNVVVYANATILGGETIIGEHSIIGGNVWLTKSTPPNSKVYYQNNQKITTR